MPTFVISFSQIAPLNIEKFVKSFMNLTELKDAGHIKCALGMLSMPPAGAIHLFNTGKINESRFAQLINETMGTKFTLPFLKQCWAEMIFELEDFILLKKLSDLQNKYGFDLHLISNTNPWHQECFSEKLKYAKACESAPQMSQTLSFEVGVIIDTIPRELESKEDKETIDLRELEDNILEEIERICKSRLRTNQSPKATF